MPTSSSNAINRETRSLLADEGTFATTLFIIVLMHYGPEFLTWTPATILHEVEDDFGIRMPQSCFDRLMAAVTIATTDIFQNDLPTFIHLCNVLSGSPITDEFDPATVIEMCWALSEAQLLELDGTPNQFTDEILYYMYEICKSEGLVSPPHPIGEMLGNVTIAPTTDFSDAPELHQAVWYNQQSTSINIQTTVQRNMWGLYQQLLKIDLTPESKTKLAALQKQVAARIQELRQQEADLLAG